MLPAIAHGQSISAVWDSSPPEEQITNYEVCVSTTSLTCNVRRVTLLASETAYAFTPTPGVLYRVAVRAINAVGPGSFTAEVPISIPSLTQPANQTSTVNTPISPLTLSAGDPDGSSLRFAHSGLPFGLSLNASTGVITGTPASSGTFDVTIFVSDDLATTTRTFVWTVQGSGSDTAAPSLAISSHTSGQTVTTSSITLAGTASDGGTGNSGITSVTVNGATATGGTASGSNTANWSRNVSLSIGANTLSVVATDGAGNVRTSTLTVTRGSGTDTTAPGLSITSHTSGQTVSASTITLSGTATDSGSGGSGITSVTVNGATANGGTATGSNTANWSRSVTLTSGPNVLTAVATDGSGNVRTVAVTITYSPSVAAVTADSATPSSGSGATQTFALRYSDSNGAANLATAWVWFNPAITSSGASSCMAYYDRVGARLFLLNDAGTSWMAGTLGTSGTLQNSQCAVSLGSSSVTSSGNTLTLNLATTFKSPFTGTKNIYMYAADGGLSSGWQARGSWAVSGGSGPTGPTVTADSATPSSGSGTTQPFALQYSDSSGAGNLATAWVWFNAAFTSSAASSCLVYYDRVAARLYLLNNAGTSWMAGTLGTSGTLQNSQCAVSLASSSVTLSGNTLTLNLAMTFKSTYTGTKNIYMYAANSTVSSGWQVRGAWTRP